MHCHICDAELSTDSIHWNNDHKDWDPCPTCLMEIAEVFSDPLDEDEVTRLLVLEWGEVIVDFDPPKPFLEKEEG